MERQISTTIRIPESLKENLDMIAKEESRSFNNVVNIILQQYVKFYLSQKDKLNEE